MPIDQDHLYNLTQPALSILAAKAELDASLTGLVNQGGNGASSSGAVGQIGSVSFNNAVAAAARVNLKETVAALQKFGAAHNEAFDAWENLAELRWSSGWEYVEHEKSEASYERFGAILKWNMNEKVAIAIADAEISSLSDQIDKALQMGDYGRAVGLSAELAAVIGVAIAESVPIDTSGVFGWGAELFEGLGEGGAAIFDALVSGGGGQETGNGTVPVPNAAAGTDGSSAATTNSGRPDTGGAGSASQAGVPNGADNSMNSTGGTTETTKTTDTSTDDAADTPGDEPAEEPADEPADGNVGESGADGDGETVLVKQANGTYKDSKTGTVYTKEELEAAGVNVEEAEQEEGAEDNSSEDAQSEDAETEDTADDGADDTSETEGYTPGHDDRGAPITPEQAAKAAAKMSSDNLKLVEENHIGPSPMGDAAKAFGDHVDSLVFDMVSRPSGIDDDPIIPDGANPFGDILDKEKELWGPSNPLSDPGAEMRGDPVPEDPFEFV